MQDTNNRQTEQAVGEINQMVERSQAPDSLAVTVWEGEAALTPVQVPDQIMPVRPAHLDNAKDEEIGKKAYEFIEIVRSDPTDYRLGNIVFQLGSAAMDMTNIQVDLYNEKMGTVLADVTQESPVFRDILALKTHIDTINPTIITKIPITTRAKSFFRKAVTKLPKGDDVLRIIAERRETVNSTVNGLRDTLRHHGDQIVRDATGLGVVCDNLKDAQVPLHEDIYLGQLQWKFLSEYFATMDAGMAKENVGYLLADLASATVSLQEVDNLNLQTRYGGALVIRNSTNVRRVIRSTNTLIGSVAAALAVRAAAARQVQVQNVAKMMQDSIHETMVDTSEKVGEAIVKSAEINQQMMVNIDMLKKSCDNFDFAAQRLTEVCSETVKIATLASNTLNDMNQKLRTRADAADSMRVRTPEVKISDGQIPEE
jgi:uncharacterized protein YaaN involved in tellurite resistance